jgi:hypothetical protein
MHQQTWISVRMRVWNQILVSFSVAAALSVTTSATTLEQLSLDDMIQQSTAIVRARITGSRTSARAGDIYTYFQLQTIESWKGQTVTEVAVPGGVANGVRQSVTGAPELKPGQEYVLFLWTGRSGLTQVIGLSQGLFRLSEEGSGGAVVQRPAAPELMLDRSGRPVEDQAVSLKLQDLRARVRQAIGAAK